MREGEEVEKKKTKKRSRIVKRFKKQYNYNKKLNTAEDQQTEYIHTLTETHQN